MAAFINITDRQKINELLSRLDPGAIPLWGKMDAQIMIGHLVNEVQYTNGKKFAELEVPSEEAAAEKKAKVCDDFELPKNVKGPSPDILTKKFKDLPSAIAALINEIDAFEIYFKKDGQTAVHGGFGAMNYKEWILWHGKHFAHHFKQFGLLDD